MAVHLRFSRAGAKKAPFYHLIATNSRSARDGRFLDAVGTYRPSTGELLVDQEKLDKWLENGAVPSNTVRSLLKKRGKATPEKETVAAAPAKEAAPAAEEPVKEAAPAEAAAEPAAEAAAEPAPAEETAAEEPSES